MGFQVSNRNKTGMVFPRNASDHHTIGLAPAEGGSRELKNREMGFDHCALGMGNVAELFKIRDFLKQNGVKIHFEGRRGPSCNVGVEFTDTDGLKIEIYAARNQIGWGNKAYPSNHWSRAKSLEEAVENPVPGARY